MNKTAKTLPGGKWLIIIASLLLCVGMATTQASAAIKETIHTLENNFTMMNFGGAKQTGGMNDVEFIWDGTQRYQVAKNNQVPNVSFASNCFFLGSKWTTHDCVLYGPGTYTVFTACPAGSPGCGLTSDPTGLNCPIGQTCPPITFTVGPNEVGVHFQFNWGSTTNIDMVNVFKRNAAFGPSPMCTQNPINGGTCSIPTCPGASEKPNNWVWDLTSIDIDGNGVNGLPFVDGPFIGFEGNMNVMVGGAGIPPNVWPDADPVNFGGTTGDRVLTIKNNGDTALNITAVQAPLPLPFSIIADNCSGTTLAPGGVQQCTVIMHFARPATGGPWQTDLLIDSNDLGTPTRVTLQAGNDAPNKPILVSPGNGMSGVGTEQEFRWNASSDINGDKVFYHVYVCTNFAKDCVPATIIASRANDKGVFYAGGAGLLMIGMTFFGGIKGRKRIALLLLIVVMSASGALIACHSSDMSGTATAASAGQVSYIATGLNAGTTYQWKVVADDGQTTNNVTPSDTWTFTTK